MSVAAHLVQLVLPVKPGSRELLTETRQELLARFGGVTAYLRSPATGHWSAPDGNEVQDDVILVEVLVEDFDGEWWCLYAELLAARFDEDEIHVRALSATVPKRATPEE